MRTPKDPFPRQAFRAALGFVLALAAALALLLAASPLLTAVPGRQLSVLGVAIAPCLAMAAAWLVRTRRCGFVALLPVLALALLGLGIVITHYAGSGPTRAFFWDWFTAMAPWLALPWLAAGWLAARALDGLDRRRGAGA